MNPMTTQRGWSHNSPPNAASTPARVACLCSVSSAFRVVGAPSSLLRGWGTDGRRDSLRPAVRRSPLAKRVATVRRHRACPKLLFLTVGLLAGDIRADERRPRSPESAAPNQSLTLDPLPQTVDLAAHAGATQPNAVLPTAPATAWTPPAADGAPAQNPQPPVRTLGLAPRRSLADTLRADAAAAPWYRGGLGATAIVVGLILFLFLCVRRWLPKAPAPDSSALRVAARVALTPRHSLALVQVGRRFLVLGLSPDHVSGVCDIQEEEEVAELKAHFGAGRPPARRFDALVAAEAEAFTNRSHRDERQAPERSVPREVSSTQSSDSWRSLTDLRRRIHALSDRTKRVSAGPK